MTQKIIDYEVIALPFAPDLSMAVKEGIKKGWQPIGGITQHAEIDYTKTPRSYIMVLCQAMVKYAESE